MNEWIRFTTMRRVFVRFLEEMEDKKKPYEITWPLSTYVYNRKGVGGSKYPLFVNIHKVENVKRGDMVIKKSQNLANVVCEWPHMLTT